MAIKSRFRLNICHKKGLLDKWILSLGLSTAGNLLLASTSQAKVSVSLHKPLPDSLDYAQINEQTILTNEFNTP